MRSLVGEALRLVNKAGDPPLAYTREQNIRLPYFHTRNDASSEMRSYSSEPTLFACVNRLATSVAQVEWNLYLKSPSGEDEERVMVTDHPAAALWDQPNKFYTRRDFTEASDQHLELTGESYWVIGSDDRFPDLPISLWPVRPDLMEPVAHSTKFISGYVYSDPDGRKIPFEPDQVIYLKYADPFDPYHGLGPVRSLLVDLDAARFAAEYNRNFFLNSAEPGGIIQYDETLDDDEFDELNARWNEQHRGTANAHRVAILTHGMEWVDRAFSMKDLQFAELRKVSDEKIMLAYGMSKVLLGQTEAVNRATAEAAEYVFGKYQMVPRLERFKQVLNRNILPRYLGGDRFEFDYESPITGNVEEQAKERDSKVGAAVALKAAGYDPAAIAEYLDLPPGLARITTSAAPPDGQVLVEPETDDVDIPELTNIARPMLPSGRHAGVAWPVRPRNADDPPAQLDPDELPSIERLEETFQAILNRLLNAWTKIEGQQKADLVAQINEIAESGSLADLANLEIETEDAVELLTDAMEEIAEDAAEAAVEEAAEQGVDIEPKRADRKTVRDVAIVVSGLVAARLVTGAASAAMRANGAGVSANEVSAAVEEHLRDLSKDGPKPMLSGALTGTQNEARLATFKAAPEGALYSSEVNDKNTCGPCRAIDGKWLGNISDIDEVAKLYPGGAFGGYVDCEGRERCRGTITGVWRR